MNLEIRLLGQPPDYKVRRSMEIKTCESIIRIIDKQTKIINTQKEAITRLIKENAEKENLISTLIIESESHQTRNVQ